ncbi:CapA family protein [Kineosporia sp. J2-2]|uniref:CapA family protein n=1 Tax=Kineosporia corallincola TaxID=2835133 RepID=A0ABS5THP3_9ACTN|nr:CapA family protein [Kineosporia corallincola]MBT0770611.1 CapA family protein [Kineosporia corallincola]
MLGVAAVIVVAGCSPSPSDGSVEVQAAGDQASPVASPASSPAVTTPAPESTPKSGRVRIAFGGDVHFEGSSAGALDGDLGTAFGQLKSADLAIVNLETAITDRGTPGPKQYTFRAPAKALDVLKNSGVDVVTLANNHGMDYGQVGLLDTLAAGKSTGLPIIGAGKNLRAAFTPFTRTVKGVRIAVFGATDVLDSFAIGTWPATATRPGLASSKDQYEELLLDAVREAAADSDVVVVDLHWGTEQQACPSDRQQELAHALTEAGAQVVVGSHAHVLEPHVREGNTTIHYGLGNFVFYAHSAPGTDTGVYNVVVDKDGVVRTTWLPGRISGGRPQLLSGSAAKAASAQEDALASECGIG